MVLCREVYVYYHPPPSAANRGFEWVVQPIVWLFYGLLAGTLFLISPLFFTNDWDFGESFSWTVSVLTERGTRAFTQYLEFPLFSSPSSLG